jgi:uncharacterized membrane protein YjfL (UPF0719 family)
MFIYDLDNENGGQILADSDTTAPALKVDSKAAGYPAISVISTPSTSAVVVSGIQGNAIAATAQDANSTAGYFLSGATIGNAVVIGRSVNGCVSIAPLKFLGTSGASLALMQFAGGFISLTSLVLTTVANFDYALPVVVGGEQRYIPLIKGAGLVGGAAF